MHNFDQCFVAKINGVWVPCKGQIIQTQGWNYLLAKHNGYAYCLVESYQRYDDGTSDEMLRKHAIAYNLGDMDQRIANDRAARQERETNRRWRTNQNLRAILDGARRYVR